MNGRDLSAGLYYQGKTGLHGIDTRLKIVAVLTGSVMIFLYDGKQMLSFAALLLVVLIISKMPALRMLSSMKSVWIIVLITALLQFFLTPGKVVYRAGFLTVTDSGLSNGLLFSSRIAALVLLLSCLTLTSPPVKIADAISFFLRPLDRLGFSLGSFAMILTVVLIFVPGTLSRIREIMKAQAARGAEFDSPNVLKRVRELSAVIVPLFIKSFRDSEEMAAAMEARAFGSGAGRTRLYPEKVTGASAFGFALFVALTLGIKFTV